MLHVIVLDLDVVSVHKDANKKVLSFHQPNIIYHTYNTEKYAELTFALFFK